jgi:aminoglycoside phosphotransferase family enzyme/predicted kinase
MDGDKERLPQVVRAMLSPDAYDHAVDGPIELIQTHISYVLLAGAFAYKIKKPLDLGFLDYSTLEKRRRMCEEEVRLNRRLCAEAYLGVVSIARAGIGYRVGGNGEAVEYAVKMRRMPADRMMPALLERGSVNSRDVQAVARLLAGFHAGSATDEHIAAFGAIDAIRANWHENFEQVAPYIDAEAARIQRDLRDYVDATLARRAPLFERRAREGRVRDCHGDLRSDSIVIHEDRSICVMDCIEFSDRIRFGDVASDIGFLAMDLDYRGRRDLSDELIGVYLGATGDETLPLVLPFYKCYRAFVRAKVESLMLSEAEVPPEQRAGARDRARRYFALAHEYATGRYPQALVVMVGLTGSGKSYFANALAGRIGAPVISSDAVRDELTPRAPQGEAYGGGRYAAEQRAAVYAAMRERATTYLAGGDSVILDATHIARAEREHAYSSARAAGVRTLVVHVMADEALTRQHMQARETEPAAASEGRWEIYEKQRDAFDPIGDGEARTVVVDSGEPLASNIAAVLNALG